MTKKQQKRFESLLPNGIPKYVRCYDNGGRSFDRYTVCYTSKTATERVPSYSPHYPYVAMSEHPFNPQGFGQHCSVPNHHCDVNKHGFAPAIGRKNHLGLRIPFNQLPKDCQKLVLTDYLEIWGLEKISEKI